MRAVVDLRACTPAVERVLADSAKVPPSAPHLLIRGPSAHNAIPLVVGELSRGGFHHPDEPEPTKVGAQNARGSSRAVRGRTAPACV
jgi:hypothetical protein